MAQAIFSVQSDTPEPSYEVTREKAMQTFQTLRARAKEKFPQRMSLDENFIKESIGEGVKLSKGISKPYVFFVSIKKFFP